MAERKKNISNVVKTIIRKSSIPDPKAKSFMSVVARDMAKKEKENAGTAQPPKPTQKTNENVAALEELKLSEIVPAEEPKPKELAIAKQPDPPKQQVKVAKEPTIEEISARAYLIWEREGRPDGCSDRHWQLAIQELRNTNS